MTKQTISNGAELIAAFGEDAVRNVVKTARVGLLPLLETKVVEAWGNKLTADPAIDFHIHQEHDVDDNYPIKQSEFNKNYELDEFDGEKCWFRKSARMRGVVLPEGHELTLNTLEGTETAVAGDFVSIGGKDEVYRITPEAFAEGYKFAE